MIKILDVWECISIIRKDKITVDFQIPSNISIMSLIHVLYSYIYKVKDPGFMQFYRVLKFRMKLSFMAW